MRVFLRCSSVWPIHDRSFALSPPLLAHLVFCDDERLRVTDRSVRIVPAARILGPRDGSENFGRDRAGSRYFRIASRSQTVSGSQDSIRATNITAMSGQFDFRSAWQNSDAIGSKASYYEGTETERIMYIIYIDTRVISFYLSVSC